MTTPLANRALSPISLDPDDLNRIFPFGVLLDRRGLILRLGSSMEKLLGQQDVLGAPVFQTLTFSKPRSLTPERVFQDALDKRITCEVSDPEWTRPVALFGKAFNVEMKGEEHILLVLTPGVNARTLVEERGLTLSDFGAADGSADLLPLLAMQEEMVADGKKKSARLEAARDEAERLANIDALTGLPNRRALMNGLKEALSKGALSVMHVDLDHFKEINDTIGHAAGDAVLQQAASGLRRALGDGVLCARLGGDELVAVIEGVLTPDELETQANRIIDALAQPFDFQGEQVTAGASIGLAQVTEGECLTPDEVLHRADLALYEVKRNGRGRALLCRRDLLTEHANFQALTAEIRRGITNREFVAFFQPQVHGETGAITGFEVLMRWHHPDRGLLTPSDFLPAAERAGLIQQMDAEVRRSALDAVASLVSEGIPAPTISLNITSRDLLDPHFRETLMWEVAARNLAASRVVLEIVESVLYDENATDILEGCRALVQHGFILALDDFGTGHASILSLVNLPMSLVKIDRAFTDGIASDPQKQSLTRHMIGMARTLGLEILAEGVNEEADVTALLEMGCRMFQSFHFGRPMNFENAKACLLASPSLREDAVETQSALSTSG